MFLPRHAITTGLVVGFTSLTGIILAIGIIGRHAMYQLRSDAHQIAAVQWKDMELASRALELSTQNGEIDSQLVLSTDPSEIRALIANRTNNSDAISSLLDQLRVRIGSEQERECFHSVLDARRLYFDSVTHLTALTLAGNRIEAQRYLVTETFPKLRKYHTAFAQHVNFQTTEMNQELIKGGERFAAIRFRMIMLFVISTLLAAGIGIVVVIRIDSEIRTRALAESALKQLNLNLEERVQASTSQLHSTIQQLQRENRERAKAQEQVQFLAYYDSLTGLPNRSLLQDRMTVALATARRSGQRVGLLYLDLDNFKSVNDTLGHGIGDLLLKTAAGRLKSNIREQDTVARLGGDEFVVLLSSIVLPTDAAISAARIVSDIAKEAILPEYELSVTCSVGISIFPDDAASVDDLLKHADAAMYFAKRNGRNKYHQFTNDVGAVETRQWILENGLRHVLEKSELFLMYQPQLNILREEIVGAEALLRWKHRELGLIPPDEFIPIAERIGVIGAIGEWVLRTACTEAKRWQLEGVGVIPVSVNVSALQFRQPAFSELVGRILAEVGLDPKYLELELTESLILSSTEIVTNVLADLTAMGVRLSIDDFGTGYSNLSYLKRFPVYKLKIDRSFVKDIPLADDDVAITKTIINMAKSLHLKVIAEGVENEQQSSFLRAQGCDELQGYYFSKPLLPEEVVAKMRERAPGISELSAELAHANQ